MKSALLQINLDVAYNVWNLVSLNSQFHNNHKNMQEYTLGKKHKPSAYLLKLCHLRPKCHQHELQKTTEKNPCFCFHSKMHLDFKNEKNSVNCEMSKARKQLTKQYKKNKNSESEQRVYIAFIFHSESESVSEVLGFQRTHRVICQNFTHRCTFSIGWSADYLIFQNIHASISTMFIHLYSTKDNNFFFSISETR